MGRGEIGQSLSPSPWGEGRALARGEGEKKKYRRSPGRTPRAFFMIDRQPSSYVNHHTFGFAKDAAHGQRCVALIHRTKRGVSVLSLSTVMLTHYIRSQNSATRRVFFSSWGIVWEPLINSLASPVRVSAPPNFLFPQSQKRTRFFARSNKPMKNGPPSAAVRMPTGISTGAMTVRAAVSHKIKKPAPVSSEAGSNTR